MDNLHERQNLNDLKIYPTNHHYLTPDRGVIVAKSKINENCEIRLQRNSDYIRYSRTLFNQLQDFNVRLFSDLNWNLYFHAWNARFN